jgi:hypothetical protein
MSNSEPVWDDDIENCFSNADIGCMRDPTLPRPIDLGSYESVVGYVNDSPANKKRILKYLKKGIMPEGGPKWDDDTFKRFKAWVHDGCPRSKEHPAPPPVIPD